MEHNHQSENDHELPRRHRTQRRDDGSGGVPGGVAGFVRQGVARLRGRADYVAGTEGTSGRCECGFCRVHGLLFGWTMNDAKEVTKRHAILVNGIVAVTSAALAGFGTFAASPKSVTMEQVREAVKAELAPVREELAIARFDSQRALSESQWVKALVIEELRPTLKNLVDSVGKVAEGVARLDERTRPKTGG